MNENPRFLLNLKITQCLKVLRKYDWLLNSYVLDFYVDNHWDKLSPNWRNLLESIPLEHLSVLLKQDDAYADKTAPLLVWPLELLALQQVLRALCLKRNSENELDLNSCVLLRHSKLKHPAMKCVKPKKRHEIERMAAICSQSCRQSQVDFVVDFGAGLGHLARLLGYGYGIDVCCIEMQSELNAQAELRDTQLESFAAKHLQPKELAAFRRPSHLTLQLDSATSPKDFVISVKNSMRIERDDFSFGIIGLHPCGNLGATLMRMFLECRQAKFLNFVGCCYQKLSTPQTQPMSAIHGYPMSTFLRRHSPQDCVLSYESREISCHAIEMYYDRLAAGDYKHLKVHSYRAAAERIIVQHFPALKHSGLKSVKCLEDMSFRDYFYKSVQGTPISSLDPVHLENPTTTKDLLHWRRIVIFYTLRLMLAPLVESVILYDRILFLLESGCQVYIDAIFDPRLSPRNHITSAVKR